ncbi:MAG TPA: response regulator [Vicinamibacteria bacterium]|nr:response regulator [Vicinamibacteria bacterium]
MTDPTSTIVIVDDSANDLDLLVESLRPLNSTLVTIKDPHEVMQSVRGLKPDVVLLDALLPGVSGFDLCLQIKSDPELKKTRVIIVTGVYLKQQYRQEATNQFRADGFVTKPFRPLDMQRLVTRLRSGESTEPAARPAKGFRLARSKRQARLGLLERLFGRGSGREASDSALAALSRSPTRAESPPMTSSQDEAVAQGSTTEDAAQGEKVVETTWSGHEISGGSGDGQDDRPSESEGAETEARNEEPRFAQAEPDPPPVEEATSRSGGEAPAAPDYQIFSRDELERLLKSQEDGAPEQRPSNEVQTAVSQGVVPYLEQDEFQHQAKRELSKCKRVYKPLTIILIEVDDMAQIVELLGKQARERVLWHVAELVKASLRDADLVAVLSATHRVAASAFACDRYGGDRFVARLRRALNKSPFRVDDSLPPIIPRLRFGMATFPQDGQEEASLLETAEADLARVDAVD